MYSPVVRLDTVRLVFLVAMIRAACFRPYRPFLSRQTRSVLSLTQEGCSM